MMEKIQPDHQLAAYLTEALGARWKKFTLELRRCRRGFSEESVHDLRVSIRRLNSSLDFLLIVFADERLRKTRRDCRKLLGTLSPLRDVQVQMLSLAGLLGIHPSLQPLYTILVLRERKLIKRGKRSIAKTRTTVHARVIGSAKRALRAMLRDPAMAERKHAGLIAAADIAFARAVQMRVMMDPARSETIHKLRVAFKKFRYTVEMLQPMLPWITKEQLKAMNAYQVKMGAIQDIEVLIATINRFALGRRKAGGDSLLPLHQELERRRKELVDTFLASVDDLYSFWRVTDGSPADRSVSYGRSNA